MSERTRIVLTVAYQTTPVACLKYSERYWGPFDGRNSIRRPANREVECASLRAMTRFLPIDFKGVPSEIRMVAQTEARHRFSGCNGLTHASKFKDMAN